MTPVLHQRFVVIATYRVAFALEVSLCDIMAGGLSPCREPFSPMYKKFVFKAHLHVGYLECGTHFPVKTM